MLQGQGKIDYVGAACAVCTTFILDALVPYASLGPLAYVGGVYI